MTFAEQAISFNERLHYTGKPLPEGIRVMNPFTSEQIMTIMKTFYRQYYNDRRPRHLIMGINPGRFGSGLTGIPFTDPKRLVQVCGIPYEGKVTHEPSSVFIYDMIAAYGGPEAFYGDFYFNSTCPLGFTATTGEGKEKNYNYYDSKALQTAVEGYILENMDQLMNMDIDRSVCFCLGTGKNEQYLNRLNGQHRFFSRIVALEHPRYIMQYKSPRKQEYIDKYMQALKSIHSS